MNLVPQPLEEQLRAERLKRQLSTLSREELEEYAGKLLILTSRLTHQAKQMMRFIVETELGILPNENDTP